MPTPTKKEAMRTIMKEISRFIVKPMMWVVVAIALIPGTLFDISLQIFKSLGHDCDGDIRDDFTIPKTTYTVRDGSDYCGQDPGQREVWARDTKTDQFPHIATWKDAHAPYDIFFMDGAVHIVLLSGTTLTQRAGKVFGFPVTYHWVNPETQKETTDFSEWREHPKTPASRTWALEHSTIH